MIKLLKNLLFLNLLLHKVAEFLIISSFFITNSSAIFGFFELEQQLVHHILKKLLNDEYLFVYCNIIIFLSSCFNLLAFFPSHVSNSKNVSFFLEISKVLVFLKPQFSNFKDSELLRFLVGKPDATAIILLSFFFIELAREYFSTAKYPVLTPSTPTFL